MKEDKRTFTRRSFVGTTGAAIAGLTILPSNVVSGLGHRAPSDKLNIAGIGIGGVGATNLRNVASSENIVALQFIFLLKMNNHRLPIHQPAYRFFVFSVFV